MEKSYHREPKEILWKVLENKGTEITYIRVIQDMYQGVSTSVQIQCGETHDFPITIDFASRFNPKTLPFYFIFGCTHETCPRACTEMHVFFADDIVLLKESNEDLNERSEIWRRALKRMAFA